MKKSPHQVFVAFASIVLLVVSFAIVYASGLDFHFAPPRIKLPTIKIESPSTVLRWIENHLSRMWTNPNDKLAKEAGEKAGAAINDFGNHLFCNWISTDRLEYLYPFDKSLKEYDEITFIFSKPDSSSYTVTTQHAKSSNTFVFELD